METKEIDLDYMEQEAEDRLTQHEALLLGLPAELDSRELDL
jgi:hypothetical protein